MRKTHFASARHDLVDKENRVGTVRTPIATAKSSLLPQKSAFRSVLGSKTPLANTPTEKGFNGGNIKSSKLAGGKIINPELKRNAPIRPFRDVTNQTPGSIKKPSKLNIGSDIKSLSFSHRATIAKSSVKRNPLELGNQAAKSVTPRRYTVQTKLNENSKLDDKVRDIVPIIENLSIDTNPSESFLHLKSSEEMAFPDVVPEVEYMPPTQKTEEKSMYEDDFDFDFESLVKQISFDYSYQRIPKKYPEPSFSPVNDIFPSKHLDSDNEEESDLSNYFIEEDNPDDALTSSYFFHDIQI